MPENFKSLLNCSLKLDETITVLFSTNLSSNSSRHVVTDVLCSVAIEHAESAKALFDSENYTSAIALIRLQYESFVRAMWVFYVATEKVVDKLATGLTKENVYSGEKLPMLAEMLSKLEGKAPEHAVALLNDFKQYSWKPLSSVVHSGRHAIHRHQNGYHDELLVQMLRASNGLTVMTGMLLVILTADTRLQGFITNVSHQFAECLPISPSVCEK